MAQTASAVNKDFTPALQKLEALIQSRPAS